MNLIISQLFMIFPIVTGHFESFQRLTLSWSEFVTAEMYVQLSTMLHEHVSGPTKTKITNGMNVDHRIRNQQILLNSLEMTFTPGVDKNHSRGAFCACV